MVLSPSEYYKIERLLGQPKPYQNRGGLFLVRYIHDLEEVKYPELQSRCNVQVYEKGILIYFSKNNKEHAMPVLFEDIIKRTFQEGLDVYIPKPYSLFWILSKCGVKQSIAKYFSTHRERFREPHIYTLEMIHILLEFQLNPYISISDKEFFKSL